MLGLGQHITQNSQIQITICQTTHIFETTRCTAPSLIFCEKRLKTGRRSPFVSAYFTINAFNLLRDELTNIKELRFLFGEPEFIQGIDPDKTDSKAFRLTEEGLGLREPLQQSEIARACEEWIRDKVKIKSVEKSNFLHGKMYYMEKGWE